MNAMHEDETLSANDDEIVRCDKLSLRANSNDILDNMSLSIPRGAVVGLVGRNGAGKSTLLRCMAGLTAPDSGSASLFGVPSLKMTDAVRERLGFVAQTPDLFDWMSVEEHLRTIGSAYSNWNAQRSIDLATRLRLSLAQKAGRLSGGDQQKLAVVLALAHEPELLLLDEPVSHLDPITRRDFMRALFLERSAGKENAASTTARPTIVISSHLLSDLERVVSHLVFIREGKLQLFDTWDAILEHVRIVPRDADRQRTSELHRSLQHSIIDTRVAPQWRDVGQTATLDQLFVELNS